MLAVDTILHNRYLIIRRIGAGGMGAVYETVDKNFNFNRTVALKESLVQDSDLKRAFKREAQLLQKLDHPALPKVYEYFEQEGQQYLIMEYIEGEDLRKRLEKGEVFTLAEVMEWAKELLNVLEYIHKQDPPLIHRDINPANLKVKANGQIMLLDFGLAKGGNTGTLSGITTVSGRKANASF